MQLKLRRSQREGGIVSKTAIFCLDARADLADDERRDLARYKLYDQVIYNSEAAKRHLDKSVAANDSGTAGGFFKGALHLALATMRLNITIRSLERGHHIECKSLEELLAAEEAIMEACQNLRLFLDVAATFNGSEVVVDFASGKPEVIAQAAHPEPILAPPVETLIMPTPAPALASAAPQGAVMEATAFEPPPNHPESYEVEHGEEYGTEPLSPFARLVRAVANATGGEEEAIRVILIGIGVVVGLVLLKKVFVG